MWEDGEGDLASYPIVPYRTRHFESVYLAPLGSRASRSPVMMAAASTRILPSFLVRLHPRFVENKWKPFLSSGINQSG